MRKTTLRLSIMALAITAAVSCKKLVETGQPKNQITAGEVFADSANANAAIAGIYIGMMNTLMGFGSGALTLYPALSADELYPTANSAVINQFYVNNLLSNNTTNNGLWTQAYFYIYSANACIEGVSASPGISPAARNQMAAEARFVRAFIYFHLVNLYGAVPLVTSADYNTSRLLPRAAPVQVYAQITADLQFAEAGLGAALANDRPTASAASAMLARVYLYQGKNDLVQAEATKVISSGRFQLEPDPNKVFLAASREVIWKLDPLQGGGATS